MTQVKTYLDFEARARVDIKKVGGWRYAMDPHTEIIAIAIAQGDGPVNIVRKDDVPAFAKRLTLRPDLMLCPHGVQFEYAMWHFIMHLRLGAPSLLDPKLWTCTQARAAMAGFPQALAYLGPALNLPVHKDLEGRAALMKICKPTGYDWLGDPVFNESPDLYEAMYKYNGIDVETTRAADKVLPEILAVDRAIFELDLLINMRGMRADTAMARSAAKLAADLEAKLDADLHRLTGGAVSAASRIGELKRFCISQGVTLPTKVSKDTGEESETLNVAAVNDLLKDPATPALARQALEIRSQAGKTSAAKYTSMLEMAGEGERLRGQYQYWGAGPGRWAGRGVQPQNLTKSQSTAFPDGLKAAQQLDIIDDIMNGGHVDGFYAKYGVRSLSALSAVIRGAIVPAEGKFFAQADLNAIEVRCLFWEADEKSALALYAQGKSPYIDMANYIYKRNDIKKGTVEYELGKRSVLGDGYGQGVDRFIESTYEETAKLGRPLLLPRELAECAVKSYREKYRTVVNLWYSAEAAAIAAVRTPGSVHATAGGRVHYKMSDDRRFLLCRLPSGRLIFYYKPSLIDGFRIFCKDDNCIHWKAMDDSKCPTRRAQTTLQYYGIAKNGVMRPESTWGGKLVENFTQGIARDVLANGMLEVEKDGIFQIVLHSHDELLTEVDEQNTDALEDRALVVHELERRMSIVPTWAPGLPLAAEGWHGNRYRK